MVLKIFQKGFNYSQDGQGNRLVYHLQGCNMKCRWCANPEGMPAGGAMIREKDKSPRLSYEEHPVDEVYEEILSCKPMFFDGGGVTFSGGEATMQFGALKELLKRLKEAGIHTAIETNGTHARLEELFPYVDQLIMDCKHWDEGKHLQYTGVPFSLVYENLKKAAREHPRLDIRTPLIGGVNDSPEDVEHFLNLFEELKGPNVTFELLKYHEFGKKKWEECGWDYEMTEKAHVTVEQIKDFTEKIEKRGRQYRKS